MDILNLSAFTITDILQNEYDFQIRLETNAPPAVCPHCGCAANLYKHDNRVQLCMDLPIHGKRVELLIKRQRYRCRECSRTFWERLNHTINEKRSCTNRLISYIEKQSMNRTFAGISEDVGVDEKTIRNIFRDYIKRLEETLGFETPNWLGIGDIHIIKPRCILTNIEERTLLDILSNQNKETVVGYLSQLPNKSRISYVTMDMWKPYKDAVRTVLPTAIIIVDKFHVVRMANEALEFVRKQLREGLTVKERRGLKHDRFILLKRYKDLTEMDKITLNLWAKNHPSLVIAYDLKELLFDLWDSESKQKAYFKYQDWKIKIPEDLKPAFAPLIKAMSNWEEEIFAYFDHRITNNDYMDTLNSLINVANRLERGYSFDAVRAKLLFTEGAFKKQSTECVPGL